MRTATLAEPGRTWETLDGVELASLAGDAAARADVARSRSLGERRLATAVLLPDATTTARRCPVLLDPYGGPHALRASCRSHNAHLTSQWFADQGFAVVVADGRGTPGPGHASGSGPSTSTSPRRCSRTRSPRCEQAAAEHPVLDLDRVAIRGWSFGGYLAALAVLRRPDVFHAAVAGAPVTEWRLYDTHYTERYLGDPRRSPTSTTPVSLLPLRRRPDAARCC